MSFIKIVDFILFYYFVNINNIHVIINVIFTRILKYILMLSCYIYFVNSSFNKFKNVQISFHILFLLFCFNYSYLFYLFIDQSILFISYFIFIRL